MDKELISQIEAIDSYTKQQDALYQGIARKIGISQVSFYILAFLCRSNEVCTQNALVEKWLHPKQTISFTVNRLVEQGYVTQEPIAGTKKKAILLTERGQDFCREHIMPVIEAEKAAFSALSEEERQSLVSIMAKHYALLSEKMYCFV